jgi:hypothetical protein
MRHIIPRGLPAAPSLGQRRQDIGHSEISRQRRFPLQFGLDELSQVRRQLDRQLMRREIGQTCKLGHSWGGLWEMKVAFF